jgi:hypothetical protein
MVWLISRNPTCSLPNTEESVAPLLWKRCTTSLFYLAFTNTKLEPLRSTLKCIKWKAGRVFSTSNIWVRLLVFTLHIPQDTGSNLNLILIKVGITGKIKRAFARSLKWSINFNNLIKRNVKFWNKVRKCRNSLNEALALHCDIIGTHSSLSEARSCQKYIKLSVNCNFNEHRKIILEMKCEIHILV